MNGFNSEPLGAGEIARKQRETPGEHDDPLVVAVSQVGKQLAVVTQWYRQLGDLSVMPGAEVLRQVATDIRLLATALHARAEDMDRSLPEPGTSG